MVSVLSKRSRSQKPRKSVLIAPSEDSEQAALVKWLEFHRIPFYHIPNGGSRNVIEAVKLKRLGVKAGVPDLCLPFGRKGFLSLYIELKRKVGGKVSNTQTEWLDLLNRLGNKAVVAYGAEEAIKIVESYLNG